MSAGSRRRVFLGESLRRTHDEAPSEESGPAGSELKEDADSFKRRRRLRLQQPGPGEGRNFSFESSLGFGLDVLPTEKKKLFL